MKGINKMIKKYICKNCGQIFYVGSSTSMDPKLKEIFPDLKDTTTCITCGNTFNFVILETELVDIDELQPEIDDLYNDLELAEDSSLRNFAAYDEYHSLFTEIKQVYENLGKIIKRMEDINIDY